MPSLPNPYGPATQIGSGLQDISNAIFNMGRAQNMSRYAQRRSEAQDAEDLAQAQLHAANMRKLNAETAGLLQANQATSLEGLGEFARGVSGLDMNTFQRANELARGGMPAGPIPEYGLVRPADIDAANAGRIAALTFQADPKGNLSDITKGLFEHKRMQNYNRAMNGEIATDLLGDVEAASKGAARYGLEGGTQYSNQLKGVTFDTPYAIARTGGETAQTKLRNAQTGKVQLEAKNLKEGKFGPEVTIDVGGVPSPRFLGQVQPTDKAISIPKALDPNKTGENDPKRKPISKGEYDMMNNHLSDLVGSEFEQVDQGTRAAILDYASTLMQDPASDWHRNPLGAVGAAVEVMAPNGFEDATGFFSPARYTPKGGLTPAPTRNTLAPNRPAPTTGAPSAAPAVSRPQAGGLPPQAVAKLREGHATTFGNGQTWMLQNGMPVQVR